MTTTIVITGANRGIGLALTRAFFRDGAHVIAAVRTPARADSLKEMNGVAVEALDVSDPASIAAFAQRLAETPVDILINNAGQSDEENDARGILALDFTRLENLIRVNSFGPLRVSCALYPHVKQSRIKKIFTITSHLGSIAGNADDAYASYRASKALVNQLMKSLANRAKRDGITVGVLHPGWVHTDMGGPQAPVSPADSAAGLKRVIETTSLAQSGQFFSFEGKPLPW